MKRTVTLSTPFIKLDQLLKFAEVASSGGEASHFIAQGYIHVGGMTATERGKKIRPGDTVVCKIPEMEPTEILVKGQER